MKKLMVALAAVASAFGLYATDPIQTDGFEGSWAKTDWDVSQATFATQAVYTASEKKEANFPAPFTTVGNNYLELKTDLKLDKAVVWSNTDTDDIGEGIYFDGLVRFEDCDETNALPFAVNGDNKLAVYTYLDSDNEAEGSHLFVAAGHFDGENWSTKYYDCGKLATYPRGEGDETGFDRVTIRAIEDISSAPDTNPGFVVFVNGKNAAYVKSDAEGIGTLALTPTAGAWNSKRSLFPSLVQDSGADSLTKITAVAFTGHGSIDDVVLTREQPAFAKDNFFTLTVAENQPITGYKYSIDDGANWTSADENGVAAIALNGQEMTVLVKDFTFKASSYEEWAVVQPADITGVVEVSKTDGGFSFTVAAAADKPAIAFTAKDGAARITIEDGASYATFAEAIANLPASGDVKLTLGKTVKVGYNTDDDVTEAFIETGDRQVVLDLNGQTITGPSVDGNYVIIAVGNFKITDSAVGGKIVAGDDDAGVVRIQSANDATPGLLTIDAGTFDGEVAVLKDQATLADATASISGGSFKSDNDSEFYLDEYRASGYKADYAEPYWTVIEKPYATIALTATHATVSGITPDQKIYEGDELEFTAVADENYEAPVVTIGEDQQEPSVSYTYTVTAADVEAKTLAISVVASATEWTITYYNDDGTLVEDPTVFATETYSVETRETQKLNAGDKEGYTFNGWTDENEDPAADGDEVTYLSDKTGEIALYGSWTAAPTAVAITLPTLPITGVDSLVVSQKVEDVWQEVTDAGEGLKIGIGNDYVVIAIPAAGYRAENPIVEATATDVAITVTEEQVTAKIAQINYVAQIGSAKFESLGAAIDALEGGETITLLANYTMTADETKIFTKNATLDLGTKTLTVPDALRTKEASFEVAEGATVTFQNGTIDLGPTSGSYGIAVLGTLNVDCTITRTTTDNHSPVFDVYDGTVNFLANADITTDQDIVRAKSLRGDEDELTSVVTTVTVAEGAKLKATGTSKPIFYCYMTCTKLVAALNGGEFTAGRAVFGDDNKSGDKKNETWEVTIDAAKAKFANDKIEYGTAVGKIIPNQKPILNTGDNWYYLQDAAIVALTAEADKVEVTGVADGDKFAAGETVAFTVTEIDSTKDVIDAVTVKGADATAPYSYEVTAADVETAGTQIAIVVTTKSAGPKPVEPGEDKELEAKTKEAAEAEIAKLAPAPTAEQIEDGITADDLQLVAVERDGTWYAVAEPAAEYTPEVNAEAEKPIEVTDTEFKATIQTKKGFYYGFVECETVGGTYAAAADFVKATGTSLTLEAPKKEGATAEFFKLSVSAIPVTVKPGE